jgi:hypothetical protein
MEEGLMKKPYYVLLTVLLAIGMISPLLSQSEIDPPITDDPFVLFANPGPSNNGGATGYAIFLNLIAAPGYTVTITDMTTASTATASATFSVEFFTRTGNALGGPVGSGPGSSPAGWTSLGTVTVTQGTTSAGVSLLFSTPAITVTPGDTVGVAMLFTGAGPRYFGTGTPPYEFYSNTGLTLMTGDSRSLPFTPGGSFFSSRALVGEIHYDAVVPVELVSFAASVSRLANGNAVDLSWATATELNNQGFFIERKTTNTDWTNRGFVEGNGTSTETKFYSFTDKKVAVGSYSYRLKQVDFDGTFRYYELGNVVEVSTPFTYNLSQNYPNPFNPATTIAWQLKNDGLVTIKVYDQLGKEVATLVNEEKAAGSYEIEFNASSLASGVYYYRINAGNFVDTKKMILMK